MASLADVLGRFRGGDRITEPESVAGRDRAVLELMLLGMFADRNSSEDERALVREFAASRPWPDDTDADAEIESATAAVRAAFVTTEAFRELVRDLCVRIDRPDDQAFALDHVAAVIEADGTLDPAELEFLAELRAEMGLPT